MSLMMIQLTEGLEGGCHPSVWLLFNFWVSNANSLEHFCRGWWKGDASLVTTYLCHTMNLHMRRRAGEDLTSEWCLRKRHTHIRFSSSPFSPNSSLSLKTCFEYILFFPLRTTWMLAANPGKHSPDWEDPGASDEHISMMLGKRNQDFQLLSHLSKRKISSDYFYNKPVSPNGASYCSGTEVSRHGQDQQLEEGVK